MRYDTLIIGAGLSGLAAGIRLAYFGKQVCILERHTTIGGLNSFYRLRGRNYDVGLHAVTNWVPPGTKTGPLSRVLRQLRLRWDDFDLSPQLESRIEFPGISLRFTNDNAVFVEEVAAAFPAQADRFRRLVVEIDGFAPEVAPVHAQLSARDFLRERLDDPLLIEMLLCPVMFYGSASPRDLDLHSFVILFRSLYREGFGRPLGGVRHLLKVLVRRYKSLGGEIRLRAGVGQIETDGRLVTGVVLDDGTRLEANQVLSSAGFVETLRMCGTEPMNAVAAPERAPGAIAFIEAIATLNHLPETAGYRTTVLFYNDEPNFEFDNPAQPCDLRSGIICSPNNFAYRQPLTEGTMRVTALANNAYWMDLPDAEYAVAKQAWYDAVMARAVPHSFDFRAAAIDTDMFTPRTVRRFTGKINGAVYGAPKKHWSGTTPLSNLFICGTDQGYLGIVGSMVSGIMMANQHVLRQTD